MDAQSIITYILSGGGTYAVVWWIWQQCPELKNILDRRSRFGIVVGMCLLITALAYGAGLWAGYIAYSPAGLLNTGVAAFGVSQLIWGALDSQKSPAAGETGEAAG